MRYITWAANCLALLERSGYTTASDTKLKSKLYLAIPARTYKEIRLQNTIPPPPSLGQQNSL